MTVVGVLIGSVKGEIPLWALRLEQGLSAAAIGLVVLAAFRMSAVLTTDKLTKTLALLSGSVTVLYSAPWLLPTIMVAGAITSYVFDGYLTPFYTTWKAKKSNIDTSTLILEASDIEQGHTSQASAIKDDDDDGPTADDDGPTADDDDEYLEVTNMGNSRRLICSCGQRSFTSLTLATHSPPDRAYSCTRGGQGWSISLCLWSYSLQPLFTASLALRLRIMAHSPPPSMWSAPSSLAVVMLLSRS